MSTGTTLDRLTQINCSTTMEPRLPHSVCHMHLRVVMIRVHWWIQNVWRRFYGDDNTPDQTNQVSNLRIKKPLTTSPSIHYSFTRIYLRSVELYKMNRSSFSMFSYRRLTYYHLPTSHPERSLSFRTERSRTSSPPNCSFLKTTSWLITKWLVEENFEQVSFSLKGV